ncbi:MAG: phosphoenolpyruvate carboxykinase [Proteobacteria bacterium]|nr:phosphoenolpyruvate carboxykinase [Pseudomonadota bacterium]
MAAKKIQRQGKQIIISTDGKICESQRELIHSEVFDELLHLYIADLRRDESPLLAELGLGLESDRDKRLFISILKALSEHPVAQVVSLLPTAAFLADPLRQMAFHEFVEKLYDYWRSFDRYMVLYSEPGPNCMDQRPHRAFNETLVSLAHQVRSLYRNTCENITGSHPRVYRHVAAGCKVGIIAVPKVSGLPATYEEILGEIPFIRQIWIAPPLIIDPPTNKRTGQFQRTEVNPLLDLVLVPEDYLCYPAQVGSLVVFIYFHQRFMGLGSSVANLFELATDEQICAGPDAVYVFGAPSEQMSQFGDLPSVFFDDDGNDLLVAAVPLENRFGYFGYLKKMTLTLHNVIMMKRGRLPFHGAMVHISLKGGFVRSGIEANILIVGDTAAGKSETLEAFRILGETYIREMRIVADDMGSIEIDEAGKLVAYGTEIGAFIRLDDLQQGYAFGQIDRAIIMSPQKVNARVVLPVASIEDVLKGYPLDYLLYANNYEEVDPEHPILEQFTSPAQALSVFREGAVMAKGTTTSTGLVHSYFANIFGPPQHKELHEDLAGKAFAAAFKSGVKVGQLRTRLGIPGYEASGPEKAARALLRVIATLGDIKPAT